MAGTVLDLDTILGPNRDQIAVWMAKKYAEWEIYRNPWMSGKSELRNYLFATDTSTTSNKKLPWKNSTTVPKLTQIRDNLHANYMAALFPNANWLTWEGDREDDESEGKRKAIEAYMRTKLRQDKAEVQVAKLILDYIDYGNCFATAKWVDESIKTPSGETIRGYVGPRIVRISPNDILFNPTADNFENSPKIVRSIKTVGELMKEANKMPPDSIERKLLAKAIENSLFIRKQIRALSQGDTFKAEGYIIDGFSSIMLYYQTDYVEILTFYGDYYDIMNQKLYENWQFTIMDRAYMIDSRPNPDWTANSGLFHAGWRQRPDNLYAMGPLDNLVGMQYRIDHLENLKADAFDLIAFPVQKIKGYVDDYDYGPGERIYCGDDGDVEFMRPDTTALNADMQIEKLEQRMEELAGAPKQAMGQRTPGEKTKYEVQILDNAGSRIFLHKSSHFEKVLFEPLLNYMLQLARHNMSGNDVVKTLDSEIDGMVFSTITKEDIVANGILHPEGASHFAQKANALQNLTTIMNSHMAADPAVVVHWSGKKIAQLVERVADWEDYHIFGENIRVMEQAETLRLTQAAQEQSQIQGATPPGLSEADPASPQAQKAQGSGLGTPTGPQPGMPPPTPDLSSRIDQRIMDTRAANATIVK